MSSLNLNLSLSLNAGCPHPEELKNSCEWIDCNLLLPDSGKKLITEIKPELLLHLAWEARPGIYWNSETNADWAIASIELLRAGKGLLLLTPAR